MKCPTCEHEVTSVMYRLDAGGMVVGCKRCGARPPRRDGLFHAVPGSQTGMTRAHEKDIRGRMIVREGGVNYVDRRKGTLTFHMGG